MVTEIYIMRKESIYNKWCGEKKNKLKNLFEIFIFSCIKLKNTLRNMYMWRLQDNLRNPIYLYKLPFSCGPYLSPLYPEVVSLSPGTNTPPPSSLFPPLLSLSSVFVFYFLSSVPLGKISLLAEKLVLKVLSQCTNDKSKINPTKFSLQTSVS